MNPTHPRPLLILTDVYETLLDMTEVRRRVNSLLDHKIGYTLWFDQLMQCCMVDNATGNFHDFGKIAVAAMQMTANDLGKWIDERDMVEVISMLKALPLREGVQECLSELKNLDFRLAALTNSSENIIRERMIPTGLISYFEKVMSAEQFGKYKPAVEVYQWAAESLGLLPGEILMVSAHSWDVCGAAAAGMQTVYINLPKQMMYPLAEAPDYTLESIEELAAVFSASNAL